MANPRVLNFATIARIIEISEQPSAPSAHRRPAPSTAPVSVEIPMSHASATRTATAAREKAVAVRAVMLRAARGWESRSREGVKRSGAWGESSERVLHWGRKNANITPLSTSHAHESGAKVLLGCASTRANGEPIGGKRTGSSSCGSNNNHKGGTGQSKQPRARIAVEPELAELGHSFSAPRRVVRKHCGSAAIPIHPVKAQAN